MERLKWLISALGGAISVFSKQYALILIFVAVVIVLDVITGLVKCKATGEKITSKKGTRGFYKKLALLVGLFFGFFLDYFIPYALSTLGLTLPIDGALFGMIIGCYIVINECISISENLYKSNPEILPKWIIKLLTNAKDQIDKTIDTDDDKKEVGKDE